MRMAVNGGDQGIHLPSILSPATSECQRRVGIGEENLILWVISWSPTIFGLENFLSLMCFLYLVVKSGHLLHVCLSNLLLNLTFCICSFYWQPVSQTYHPLHEKLPSFVLHKVPVICICKLLVLLLEETVALSSPSLCHHDFLHPGYFPLVLFVSFQRGDLGCLFLQPELWEPSWDLILWDTLPWTSPNTRASFWRLSNLELHTVFNFLSISSGAELEYNCRSSAYVYSWELAHLSSKQSIYYSDISASVQPCEMLRTSKCTTSSIPLQVLQVQVVFLYAMGNFWFLSPFLFTLWGFLQWCGGGWVLVFFLMKFC